MHWLEGKTLKETLIWAVEPSLSRCKKHKLTQPLSPSLPIMAQHWLGLRVCLCNLQKEIFAQFILLCFLSSLSFPWYSLGSCLFFFFRKKTASFASSLPWPGDDLQAWALVNNVAVSDLYDWLWSSLGFIDSVEHCFDTRGMNLCPLAWCVALDDAQ